MVKYKPIYVHAGRLEDGTYGIFRTCGNMVMVYDTKEKAELGINKNGGDIIVDIGLVVDMNLMEGEGLNRFLDIEGRRLKFGLTK